MRVIHRPQRGAGGHGYRADLDGAEVRGHKLRGVGQDDEHTVAPLHARAPQRVSGLIDQRGDLRVTVAAAFADDGGVAAAALRDVPVHKV